MKRKFLLALVGIAAMFTGCNKEGAEDFTAGKATSFNVSVDDGAQTRADVANLTRYVMEIYKGATATGTPELHKEQATGSFTDVVLDNAQQYTLLFWADYGTPTATGGTPDANNEYNAADLKAAKIAKQPTKPAYAGLSRFTVGTDAEATYTAVTLKHAVAQVNFKQTEALATATNTLIVKYPKSYSLNVDGNAVTEVAGEVTHTFTYNSKAIGTLGTSYLIAATSTPKTMLDITATLNSEAERAVSNVPFERNYRTNISGAYSNMYDATLTVTCEDTWKKPDTEIKLPITWATGNLVVDANGDVKIGTDTDKGLYFQFGSLIGWSSEDPLTIVVKPSNFDSSDGKDAWASAAKTWGEMNGLVLVPFTVPGSGTANEIAGIGDPCRYYLKGIWRLPTSEEYAALFGGQSYTTNLWTWHSASTSAVRTTDGLKFRASGQRQTNGTLDEVGSWGRYWSASPRGYDGGHALFDSSMIGPENPLEKICGATVRCVHD